MSVHAAPLPVSFQPKSLRAKPGGTLVGRNVQLLSNTLPAVLSFNVSANVTAGPSFYFWPRVFTWQNANFTVLFGVANATSPAAFRAPKSTTVTQLTGGRFFVQCLLPPGYGVGLVFSLWQSNELGLMLLSKAVDAFSYPLPTVAPLISRISDPIAGPTASLTAVSTLGTELLRINGSNLFFLPARLPTLRFGPASQPTMFACTIDAALSTNTSLVCRTPTLSGLPPTGPYRFTISFLGLPDFVSAFSFAYPVAPQIRWVRGCTPDPVDSSATVDCPTTGTLLQVCATTVSGVPTILVNDRFCFVQGSLISPPLGCDFVFLCLLGECCAHFGVSRRDFRVPFYMYPAGPGAGVQLSISILANQQYSFPLRLISYAGPTVSAVSGCQSGVGFDCKRTGGNLITIRFAVRCSW
jgi:hypothetical protein